MSKASNFNILYNKLKNEDFEELKQTGIRKDVLRDASRKALMPGKRISKNNKVYWETRKNRTDRTNSTI